MRPVGLLVLACVVTAGWAGRAGAQAPRGSRLLLAGEATGTLGPEDRGYFNETDYGENALRLLRLALAGELRLGDRLALVGEARSHNLDAPELQALYLRARPLRARRFDLQAGRVPPVFGSYARRRYTDGNPLIGYPLAYQYLTAIRPDALPATTDDLARMRASGWRLDYPVGAPYPRAGLPLVSALRWDTGLTARLSGDALELDLALTQGTVSSPRVRDDNGGKQLAGRLEWRPAPGLVAGASAARGAYLDRRLEPLAAGSFPSRQRAIGLDLEYSRGPALARGELLRVSWDMPALRAPEVRGPLAATAGFLELRWRLAPGLDLAARADRLSFARGWDAGVSRLEAAVAYSLRRQLRLKAAYQHNWRAGGYRREAGFVACQAHLWF
jgi:hypothetical protein